MNPDKELVTRGRLVHLKIVLNKYKELFEKYLNSERCVDDFKRRIFITKEQPTIDRYYVVDPIDRIVEVTNIAKMKDGTYEAVGYSCIDMDIEVDEFNKKYVVYPCMLGIESEEIVHLVSFKIR